MKILEELEEASLDEDSGYENSKPPPRPQANSTLDITNDMDETKWEDSKNDI